MLDAGSVVAFKAEFRFLGANISTGDSFLYHGALLLDFFDMILRQAAQ